MPAITQTGANTFGCLLSGQVWRPAGGLLSGSNLSAEYVHPDELLINTSRETREVGQYFNLRLTNLCGPGVYVLDAPTTAAIGNYVHYTDLRNLCEYESNSGPVGLVDITRFDQTAKIVSGRFAFTLRKLGCPDVHVTDGRFDLRYR